MVELAHKIRYNYAMNIITVIPLTRSKMIDTLSYFTSSEVSVGAIVSIPVRSKIIRGIVSEVKRAEDIKEAIRNATYQIRKLGAVKAVDLFPESFMEACRELAEYYATSLGSIIDSLTSSALFESLNKIAKPPRSKKIGLKTKGGPNGKNSRDEKGGKKNENDQQGGEIAIRETYAVQGDDDDRMSSWRSLIRQEFAKNKSVAFYVPSIEDSRVLFDSLQKGVEKYIFRLNSEMTKKEVIETWNKIAKTKHSVVVIATGSFSVLPRSDIESVVIEMENGRGYMAQKKPFIDIRHALETIARKAGQNIHLSDNMLRAETLRRFEDLNLSEGSPFKWRSVSNAQSRLIDMTGKNLPVKSNEPGSSTEEKAITDNDKKRFRIISMELEALIRKNKEENTHLFIMTARKGLATSTVCGDCGAIVSCAQCSAPVVLHNSSATGRNFFMCHKCGERRSADETCKTCGGWRLMPLGVGVEGAAAEIKERVPEADIFKIELETKNEKQISYIIQNWKSKPGGVLVGTESALNRLSEKIEHVAVASIDSLFALPDFRIEEKIMYLLIRLRAKASRLFLVQTRRPEEPVFGFGLSGNLSDFYRNTIADRRRSFYPPFSTLIKITVKGQKDAIAAEMDAIRKMIEPRDMDIFPAFTAAVRGNSIIHGLVKVKRENWPDEALAGKLRLLPPSVTIKINPESLL